MASNDFLVCPRLDQRHSPGRRRLASISCRHSVRAPERTPHNRSPHLGPQILMLPLLIIQAIFLLLLTLLGFSIRGIVAGSPAASYQSLCYGGNTPAASLFAILQSIGMKYHAVTSGNWVLAVVRLFAGVVFVYVVLGMTVLW
ncbi:hypothetical protein FB45DRAFT_895602 [Roridomyces roridus]|uniref:Uncharacterized protein n=1 Tax=Roridomyces roridus TaxID=1738132 RepID=A0AAD7FWP6_9AGAR|nr:hypothetical protein FB45DRAFT_895602 [Roridomyces roridus]